MPETLGYLNACVLRLVFIWSQTIAERRSQIADDHKESCFHLIADDRRRSQTIAEPTVRSAEVSKLHARCAGGKIAANNMTDVEEEILLQAQAVQTLNTIITIFQPFI